MTVRYIEGVQHGFLVLHDMQGKKIADGEMLQRYEGNHLIGRLILRFKDRSLYDDTVTFSQQKDFRVLSEHLIEKGPSFKQPSDTYINASTGQVKVHYVDEKGVEKNIEDKVEMPPDLANGLLSILLKNIPEGAAYTLSMLITTPKPRIVKLKVDTEGEEPVYVAGTRMSAIRFRIKIDFGGITGLAAKVLGKQPADLHFWILKSDTPGFLKMQGQLYEDGPIWQMELSTPSWPRAASDSSEKRGH